MLREERQMSEEMIVRQCSPTMAGLKTGNLFASPDEDSRALNKSISGYLSVRRVGGHLYICTVPKSCGLIFLMKRREKFCPREAILSEMLRNVYVSLRKKSEIPMNFRMK